MDFFRPVRSTDPLVSRPVPKPGPTVIPAEKVTSLPPALKESPNAEKERDVYNLSKPPVYSSSVIVEQTVISKKPAKKPERVSSFESDYESPFERELEESFDDDDWFDSLKEEGFFSDSKSEPEEKVKNEPVKLDRETKGRSLYSFTGESPFLKSVQVEKRPLSRSVPMNKRTPVFDAPIPSQNKRETKKSAFKTPTVKPRKEKAEKRPVEHKGVPFWVTILLTIILGIAAGIAVFVLIA